VAERNETAGRHCRQKRQAGRNGLQKRACSAERQVAAAEEAGRQQSGRPRQVRHPEARGAGTENVQT